MQAHEQILRNDGRDTPFSSTDRGAGEEIKLPHGAASYLPSGGRNGLQRFAERCRRINADAKENTGLEPELNIEIARAVAHGLRKYYPAGAGLDHKHHSPYTQDHIRDKPRCKAIGIFDKRFLDHVFLRPLRRELNKWMTVRRSVLVGKGEKQKLVVIEEEVRTPEAAALERCLTRPGGPCDTDIDAAKEALCRIWDTIKHHHV